MKHPRLATYWFIRSTALALALAACSTPAPSPQQSVAQPTPVASRSAVTVFESTCYFTCESYEIEVRPDGGYLLNNMKNTRKDGTTTGKFDPAVWTKAQAALDVAHFETLPDKLIGSTMAGKVYCMNDLPDIHFTRRAADGTEKKVIWNTGCPIPELQKLRDELHALFQYAELVKRPPQN